MNSQPSYLADTSEERTNFTRLARLVIDGGTHVLREFLYSLYPCAVLPIVLKKNETKLRNLKTKSKIFVDQLEQLFPSSGSPPDTKTFDITLLHLLLREICYLVEPVTGWHNMPEDEDSSREAHIVRVKCFRNELCHRNSTAIPNDEFETKWTFVSRSLVALGLDKKEIDQLKTEPIDHDTERRLEEEIKRFNDLEPRVHSVEQQLQRLQGQFQTMNVQASRAAGLCSCLPDEIPEVFGRLHEIQQATNAIISGEAAAVMITGAPGFGKTTVANKVAHELAKLQQFVFYCFLRSKATLKDVATSMILACSTNHTQPPENPQHWLLNWSKQQLQDNITFVLDNADDALESQDSRSQFLSMMCEMRTLSQQKITFVITSRKTMNATGYHLETKEIRMRSLSPDEAMKLLLSKIDNAETRNKLSQTKRMAELCGCVPLALCIVGSLLSDFEEDLLINSLEKEPLNVLQDDEVSLENTIKTSFDLLTPQEQKALAIFSVFPGPFDFEAAQAVGKATLHQSVPQTMTTLRALKSRSLLEQPSSSKFHVHQLIQVFAKKIYGTNYDAQLFFDVEKVACAHFVSRIADNAELYWSKDKCREAVEAFNKDRDNFEHFLQVYVKTMVEHPHIRSLENCTKRLLEQFPQKCMYLEMCLLPSFYISILEEFLKHFEAGDQPFHTAELLCLLSNEKRKIGKQEQYKNLMKKAKDVYSGNYRKFRTHGLSQVIFFNSYARYLFEMFQELPEKNCVNVVYHVALKLCNRKLNEHPEKAATLLFIGKREKNIHVLKNATDIFTSCLGEHFMTAQGHKAIADHYLKDESELDTSIEHYWLALEMMNNCGMKGHKETTLTLKNYALCQRRKGNYQEALTYLEKAKRVAEIELENDHKWKVMIDTQLALLYEDLSQTEGAIAIMKNALEMCLRLKLTIDHLGGSRHDIRQFLEYHPEACPENLL